MSANPTVVKFRKILETVFSHKAEKIAVQIDFDRKFQHLFSKEYEVAIKIIIATKTADLLEALMKTYLETYGKHIENKNLVNFYRSDQLYLILIEQSAKVTSENGSLFQLWDKFLKGDEVYNSFKNRYKACSGTIRSSIDAFRLKQREKERNSKSILQELKNEYERKYGQLKNINELYAFDPRPEVKFKTRFDEAFMSLKKTWNLLNGVEPEKHIGKFNKTLTSFKNFIGTSYGKDVMVLFQYNKYARDLFKSSIEVISEPGGAAKTYTVAKADSHEIVLFSALYAITCVELMKFAQVDKQYKQNRYGFTPDEIDFFSKPLNGESFKYASNIQKTIAANFKNVEEAFEKIIGFLNLYFVAKTHLPDVDFLNLEETLKIQKVWNDIYTLNLQIQRAIDEKDSAAMQTLADDPKTAKTLKNLKEQGEAELDLTKTGAELSKYKLKVGSTIGVHKQFGPITIVYMKDGDIYLEFQSLKPQLFKVSASYVKKKVYVASIMSVYYSTIGMTYITQGVFLTIGFLPVLVEFGFAGLIYEVALFYTGTKVEEKISEINPTLGKIVGFAFELFAPRPNFKPKTKVPDNIHLPNEVRKVMTAESSSIDFATLIKRENDLSEGLQTFRGVSKKAVDKTKDLLAKRPALTGENAGKVLDKAQNIPFGEKLAELAQQFLGRELATPGGVMLRKVETKATGAGIGGGRGISEGKIGRVGDKKLKSSIEYKNLEDYKKWLSTEDLRLLEKELNTIIKGMERGLGYTTALQKVKNLLNAAKERTGERVADELVASNFEIIKEVLIPRRGEKGVVILDKVYLGKNRETKRTEYVLAEVKGGTRTRLGEVNAYIITFKNGNVIWKLDTKRKVKQASGEWYYQRIFEIYEKQPALARKLFEAAKKGDVQSMIIKSGIKLEPMVTFNTADVISFFKNKAWPAGF